MNDLVLIIGKSYFSGFILFIFYSIFIKKESYFILSRIYLNLSSFLLMIFFLSEVFSFSIFNLLPLKSNNLAIVNLPEIIVEGNSNSEIDFNSLILNYSQNIYWAILGIFASIFIVRIISLVRFIILLKTLA